MTASTTRRVTITILGNAVAPLAALASAPLLARVLGVDGRGDVASATSLLFLATAVVTFGMPTAVTWMVASGAGRVRSTALRGALVSIAAGLVASAAMILASPALATNPEVREAMVLAAVALTPTLVVGITQAVAAGAHAWRLLALDRTISALGRLAALVGLTVSGSLDVRTATMVLAFSPLLGLIAYVRLRRAVRDARASSPADGDTVSDGAGFRMLVRYGLQTWVGGLSGVVLSRLDQVLIAPLDDATALGLYVAAVSVSELPLVVTNAIRDVMFTTASGDRDLAALAVTSRRATIVAVAASLPVAATVGLWMPTVFGAEFAAAVPATIVLIAAVVLGNPGSLAGVGLGAIGRPGLRSISLLVAAVVNVIALVALVPVFGATGAAFATLLGNTVASHCNIVWLTRVAGTSHADFYVIGRRDVAEVVRIARSTIARRGVGRPGG